MLLYEIDPILNPALPLDEIKCDNFYDVSQDYTLVILDLSSWRIGLTIAERYFKLPRMLWMKKSWNMKEVHKYVFKYIREVLSEWLEWADPNSKRILEPA